jgi:hypothetical protein
MERVGPRCVDVDPELASTQRVGMLARATGRMVALPALAPRWVVEIEAVRADVGCSDHHRCERARSPPLLEQRLDVVQ